MGTSGWIKRHTRQSQLIQMGILDGTGVHGCELNTEPDTGLVELNLPVRDVMELDEGCNGTCHSEEWGAMCDLKLKRLGCHFKWVDSSETPSFAGIGARTQTLGRRVMSFGLLAQGGKVVKGDIDSFEISGSTPMLVSLYAQCTLGMIKSLETGQVSVKYHGSRYDIPPKQVQANRTPSQGLLSSLADPSNPKAVASDMKFLRQISSIGRTPGTRGSHGGWSKRSPSWTVGGASWIGLQACGDLRGQGQHHHGPNLRYGEGLDKLVIKRLDFLDPAKTENRGHIGRHPKIISGLVEHCSNQVEEKLRSALEFIYDECGPGCVVVMQCRSNRRRSVAMGTLLALTSHLRGTRYHLHHAEAHHAWQTMNCGASCDGCRQDRKAAIWGLTPASPTTS